VTSSSSQASQSSDSADFVAIRDSWIADLQYNDQEQSLPSVAPLPASISLSASLSAPVESSSPLQASQSPAHADVAAIQDSFIAELQDNDQEPSLPSVAPLPANIIVSPLQPLQPPSTQYDACLKPLFECMRDTAREWFLHCKSVIEREVEGKCARSHPQAPTSSLQLAHDLSRCESLLRAWLDYFQKIHK